MEVGWTFRFYPTDLLNFLWMFYYVLQNLPLLRKRTPSCPRCYEL